MLMETVTAPGGIRLQPTREENIQNFMARARGFAVRWSQMLQSRMWQVSYLLHFWIQECELELQTHCMEDIFHHTDHELPSAVVQLFEDAVVSIKVCIQSPQTFVKDKAQKVLGALSKEKEASVTQRTI